MTDVGAAELFVVIGAGGHGREVLDLIDALDRRAGFAGFVDDSLVGAPGDDEAVRRLTRRGAAVLGDVDWLATADLAYVIGIGSSSARREIDERLTSPARPDSPVLVHPTASIGSDDVLEPGVIVGAGAVVTTNVRLGRHTHLNVGCAVQHDSVVGAYVTFSPGVLVNGDVTIGDDVFFGTGAVVTRGVTIGAGATVGAGAVVLSDVAPGSRVWGVPARPA